MSQNYSRLPLSPAEKAETGPDLLLDPDLDFYDDFSLKKKLKTNQGREAASQFQHDNPSNAPPSKPIYSNKLASGRDQHIPRPLAPPQNRQAQPLEDFVPLPQEEITKFTFLNYPPNRSQPQNYRQEGSREYSPTRDYPRRSNQDYEHPRYRPNKPSQELEDPDALIDPDYIPPSNRPPSQQHSNWGYKPQTGNWGSQAPNPTATWGSEPPNTGSWGSDNQNNDWDSGENSSRRDNRRRDDFSGGEYQGRDSYSQRDYQEQGRRENYSQRDSRDSRDQGRRDNYQDRSRYDSRDQRSSYDNRDYRDKERDRDRDREYRDQDRNSRYQHQSNQRNDWDNLPRQSQAFQEPDLQFYTEPQQIQYFPVGDENNRRRPQLTGLMAKAAELPIFAFKSEIVESIKRDQVTIISGDTGCGKSTQIPKYILDECFKRNEECRIICTQPRRIAAITLAKRVQEEISEIYTDADPRLVGYHIGMETNFNKSSKIIFVTNGIFLQRFIHEDENTEGGILKSFTHIILDEIHERDIDSDFIMVALKHVLSKHPKLKLILMSATINAELFAKYFSKKEIDRVSNYFYDFIKNQVKSPHDWDGAQTKWERISKDQMQILQDQAQNLYKISADSTWGNPLQNPKKSEPEIKIQEKNEDILIEDNHEAPVIKINTNSAGSNHQFNIYTKYLDQIKEEFNIKCSLIGSDFSKRKAIFHDECIKVCLQLISYLTSSRNKFETRIREKIAEEMAEEKRLFREGKKWPEHRKRTYLPYMLIFLPGLSEIYHLMDVISDEKTLQASKLDLIPLHSTLSDFNQQRLFSDPEHPDQRKIIVSTNIAESSITIPNVLYVIDFCLLKEITTSGRNNIEILDLVWGSKASLRQRAGRTGRVSDGYVFRLLPEYFYEGDLDAFSKPELHRSPLDKLILRIKTLHESEKLAKKPDACLFDNPKEVLGRAIEPPQLESIALAARNLQDNGALTTTDEAHKNNLGEITFLGKVYCDLPCEVKVTKMILLGLALGLKEEVITLAAILGQRKAMFRPDSKAVPRNRFAYMQNLWKMTDGTHSDHIALLRTYAAWEKKFIPVHTSIHRIRKIKPRYDEREYCQDRQLDPSLLREIFLTKHDIVTRLKKLEILKANADFKMEDDGTTGAERKYFWEDDNLDKSKVLEKYNMLKFVLAGAFYCTYIKPSENKKQFDTNQSNYIKSNTGMDPLKTIVIRHTYKGVENWPADKVAATKQNWNKMLKKFNPQEIKFIQDKAYISFAAEDYEFSIKALDYIKRSYYDISKEVSVYNKEAASTVREELKFNHSHNSKNSNLFYSHWMDPDCVGLFAGLGEVEYFNAFDLVDYISRKRLKVDPDSINNIVPIKTVGAPVCLVTQDYFEKKSGILSAKYATMLDFEFLQSKHMLPLITMIFAPQISLEPDAGKTRYKHMLIDGNEIDLDFYLTLKDIEEINEIRLLLQNFFMNKDRNSYQNTYLSLWTSVQNLFNKEKVLYIPQEKWEETFRRECANMLSKSLQENPARRRRQPPKRDEKLFNSIHCYLNPIDAPDLPNARFANYSADQDAAIESQKYYSLYIDWKKSKVQQIKKTLRLIDQKTTYLACAVCGTKLCDFTCIGDEVLNGFYRHLKCSEFIFKPIACSSEDAFYSEWNLDKIKHHKFLHHGEYHGHSVLGCYQNHELALKVSHRDFSKLTPEQRLILYKKCSINVKKEGGMETENENIAPISSYPIVENLYLTRFSNLNFVYPDDTIEPFPFDEYNREVAILKNQEKYQEREKRLQHLTCPICQTDKFESKDDYKVHMKNKVHLEEYKKFIENIPELPE